jgi:hypothetical protein
MNRICKSAILASLLLALAGGALVACGGADGDADHDHKPGEKHDDHK